MINYEKSKPLETTLKYHDVIEKFTPTLIEFVNECWNVDKDICIIIEIEPLYTERGERVYEPLVTYEFKDKL